MQDRIVVARAEINAVRTALILLGIAEREVVADQVVVGAIGKQNTVRTVVIGGIPADRGIGGAVDVDTRPGGARYRLARVADMVVREGDVVRAEHVNTVVHRAGNGETVDHNVALARHPEGAAGG